jgi:tetratricopeptide (TPR) repeat protein
MADVFVSYASEDRDRAALIVRAIEQAGLTAWWDIHIGIGNRFDMEIEQELDSARCVLVLWSENSVDSHWVRAEAGEGLERGDLIQVMLSDRRPPLVFRQHQAFRFPDEKTNLSPLIEAIEKTILRKAPAETGPRQSLFLVADVENRTDDPRLTGTIPAALEIGLDHLSDVFLYPRDALLSLADRHQAFLPKVRDLAAREGLDYVLGGAIDKAEGGCAVTLELLNLADGESRCHASGPVGSEHILRAVASGLEQILEASGISDPSASVRAIERLDLQCIFEDQLGCEAQARHEHESAIRRFRAALQHDDTFAPSCIGLAISFDCLDRPAEGSQALRQMLAHLDGLSERERLRTQGMYYLFESENYGKALEHMQALLKISPLEVAAINNAALARCNLLDFKGAVESMSKAVSMAPEEPFYRVNLALYCMYAGEFDRAMELARGVIAEGMDSVDSCIALGCSLYATGREQEAVDAFSVLLQSDQTDHLQGLLALADLALATGNSAEAGSLLDEAATINSKVDGEASARVKLLQAEVLIATDRCGTAADICSAVLDQCSDARLIAAGSLLARDLGDAGLLQKAATSLKRKLDDQSQAFLQMIESLNNEVNQDYLAAERALRRGLEIVDLWMLHYALAGLYERLDMGLEAKLERDICLARSGEGVTAWINRMPTCRYLARVRESS